MTNIVAYYRISKPKKRNGVIVESDRDYSITAQKEDINRYINSINGVLVAEYTEVESGSKNNRRELADAIKKCQESGANLVVSRADRLSREWSFLTIMKSSGIKFVCADNPDINSLVLHILLLIAEDERKTISLRTKKGLDVAKREKGEWRVSNFNDKGRRNAAKARVSNIIEKERVPMLFMLSLLQNGYSVNNAISRYNESFMKDEHGLMSVSKVRFYKKHSKKIHF